jgi:hypothetical protein
MGFKPTNELKDIKLHRHSINKFKVKHGMLITEFKIEDLHNHILLLRFMVRFDC